MLCMFCVQAQPTRVQDLSAVNVTAQSQADRVNINASYQVGYGTGASFD